MMQYLSSGRNLLPRPEALLPVFLLILCSIPYSVRAQVHPPQQNTREDNSSFSGDPRPSPRVSDLAAENYGHLAAAAADIRDVLLRDGGLLVELKRIAIKEATDNAQIVEDSSLTDDAIFSRLERDVRFRSLATRLVQRYGYLIPKFNPDSELAKERDLILKERAHRQVQIESQEDAEIDAEIKKRANLELSGDCQNDQQSGCNRSNSQRMRRPVNPNLGNQGQPSDQGTPFQQQLPINPTAGSEVLRARNETPNFNGGASGGGLDSLQQLATSRDPAGLDAQSLGCGGGALDDSGNEGRASRIAQMMSSAQGSPTSRGDLGGLSLSVDPSNMGSTSSLNGGGGRPNYAQLNSERRRWNRELRGYAPLDLSAVSMVHRPNPYANIPSLYDMYVQASNKQGPLQRFGLDVFRNQDTDLDNFPIDLPAGPDYMVGPGDGLAIDLWGGVSQRISRTVDRQGRISLPESGPVLVSGHTLAEVQQTVQKVLRANYRDVSADVSLSRLRSVRVYVVGDVAQPGAYDISSLSTPLNALFQAGGISDRGSLRTIKHYRGNKLVEEVDAYDLLLHGVRGEMAHFESGDTLLVDPTGPQVTIDGMVRRPAIYELNSEKNLADALDLAGGILPAAALQHMEVQRLVAHEKRTMLTLDISAASDPESITKQLSAFKIQDGDQIHIFPIAPYNESAIYLQGHVVRPGRYSFTDNMKFKELIWSYADLLPEPAGHYAEIGSARYGANFRPL